MRGVCVRALVLALACASGSAADELGCLIEPKAQVTLAAPVDGVIEAIHVDRGDFVHAGDLVVQLEADVERSNVAIAKARAESSVEVARAEVQRRYSRRALERQEELSDRSVISNSVLDDTRREMELAELAARAAAERKELARLELQRAEAALALRSIRAPVDGVVVRRLADPGEFVADSPILELAQVDPLYVEVFAPLSLRSRFRPGTVVSLETESGGGERLEASVDVVDEVADSSSGTFGVRLELRNPERRELAGLSCRVVLGDGTGAHPAAGVGARRVGEDERAGETATAAVAGELQR